MRKKDDKVGNKTHGYTKEKAGKGKKEREKAYVERSKYGRPKNKKKKRSRFITSNKQEKIFPYYCKWWRLFELYKFKFFLTINYGANLNQLNEVWMSKCFRTCGVSHSLSNTVLRLFCAFRNVVYGWIFISWFLRVYVALAVVFW